MAEAAFTAKYDLVSNAKKIAEKGNPNLPPMQIAVNFTPEDAVKAAQWLMAKADECHREGTTMRVWDAQTKTATNVPGFTLWGACWGQRGEFSPLMPQGAPAPQAAPPLAAPAAQAPVAAGWG